MPIDPKDSEMHRHENDGARFQCEVNSLFTDEPNPCWPDDEPDRDVDPPE